jgi:hypothetical protein
MERERSPFATRFADWNGLGRRIGWITSQQSALQFKDLTWKENRSRSPLTRITSTSLSVTTAPFGDSPSTPMVPHGISCRASRNHRANLRVPDSDGVLSRNSFRSPARNNPANKLQRGEVNNAKRMNDEPIGWPPLVSLRFGNSINQSGNCCPTLTPGSW